MLTLEKREDRGARLTRGTVPAVSPGLWNWFTWYAGRYLARHFHAVRLLAGTAPRVSTDPPLVIYANHPGWHDPLVGLMLARRFFPARRHFAPIDAQALGKYRLLQRVGFFGIDPRSRQGAVDFLRTCDAIATLPQATIWLTPQGEFSDPRARPLRFKPGLAHLAQRLPEAILLPLALEYVYWNESRAEVLCAWGEPVAGDAPRDQAALEARLAETQDRLAVAAIARRPEAFETLLSGRAGIGGVYDLWRRGVALMRGQRFDPRHEEPPR